MWTWPKFALIGSQETKKGYYFLSSPRSLGFPCVEGKTKNLINPPRNSKRQVIYCTKPAGDFQFPLKSAFSKNECRRETMFLRWKRKKNLQFFFSLFLSLLSLSRSLSLSLSLALSLSSGPSFPLSLLMACVTRSNVSDF